MEEGGARGQKKEEDQENYEMREKKKKHSIGGEESYDGNNTTRYTNVRHAFASPCKMSKKKKTWCSYYPRRHCNLLIIRCGNPLIPPLMLNASTPLTRSTLVAILDVSPSKQTSTTQRPCLSKAFVSVLSLLKMFSSSFHWFSSTPESA